MRRGSDDKIRRYNLQNHSRSLTPPVIFSGLSVDAAARGGFGMTLRKAGRAMQVAGKQ